MSKPVIALVGRPNVGKSTLFNRLTRTRDALVADLSGLTRDRKYGEGEHEGRHYILVDTGGISGLEAGIDAQMAQQAYTAMKEANIVLFIVDAQAGLTPADEHIAKELRVRDKTVILVVNKVDGREPDGATAEFYKLGFTRIVQTAASQNRGMRSLMEEALAGFEAEEPENASDQPGIRIGIIGRPNVGKSTLVNRMLGEERVIVYDQPGTTRDSIYIPYERHGKPYTIIDTAGVRRRKNIDESVEKFSIVKTLQAVKDAHVIVLVIDAQEGLVDQDLHLLGFAMDAGRAIVIAVNKWDGLSQEKKDNIKSALDRRLDFITYAKIHFISALHGTGVGEMYPTIDRCYKSAMVKWPTPMLTKLLEDAVLSHAPPMVSGRRIKLRYAHQGGSNPPVVVVHGNQTDSLPKSYRRYLENTFRTVLKVEGTPIRFEFKSGENPFAGRANNLNIKQQQKKKRLMKHVKSLNKKPNRRSKQFY
ncbi:ribosome biogenesis GTPase Der [Allohahella sp. A8]|uniref:ribosome biogenesis GTPase Der n=1 Tax=Allohahella sp. A8 TaxID=3141461 RepID=UPI000C0A4367|nr:ribosome biogenesis GTPase Der [Hahellaceae bacterium]|tara:strand:- start:11672 stop:13099 length:1428 start_codon:yes stop_codon:yes gene_type:complete